MSTTFYVFEEINCRWCRHNTVALSHIRNTMSYGISVSHKEGGGSEPARSPPNPPLLFVTGLVECNNSLRVCVCVCRTARFSDRSGTDTGHEECHLRRVQVERSGHQCRQSSRLLPRISGRILFQLCLCCFGPFSNYVTLGEGRGHVGVIICDGGGVTSKRIRTLQLYCLTIVVSSDTQAVQCLVTAAEHLSAAWTE